MKIAVDIYMFYTIRNPIHDGGMTILQAKSNGLTGTMLIGDDAFSSSKVWY